MEHMLAGILIFVVTLTTIMSVKEAKNQPLNHLTYKGEFIVPDHRVKRMAINFARIGKKAASKLLSKATKAKSSGRKFRNYEKDGDIGTAMNDFYSVRPVKVYEAATKYGVKVLRGTVGDRDLMLYIEDNHGFPVLEIINYLYRNSGNPYIDRIKYKTGVLKNLDP